MLKVMLSVPSAEFMFTRARFPEDIASFTCAIPLDPRRLPPPNQLLGVITIASIASFLDAQPTLCLPHPRDMLPDIVVSMIQVEPIHGDELDLLSKCVHCWVPNPRQNNIRLRLDHIKTLSNIEQPNAVTDLVLPTPDTIPLFEAAQAA